MVATVNTRTLENSARNLVQQFTFWTTGVDVETNVVKVNAVTLGLSTNPCHTKVRRIKWVTSGAIDVRIQWDGATPTDIAILEYWGVLDFSDTEGIWNDATTPTGNIIFSTFATSANNGYSITLYMVKGI